MIGKEVDPRQVRFYDFNPDIIFAYVQRGRSNNNNNNLSCWKGKMAKQQIAKSGTKCFKPRAHSPLGKERGQWGEQTGGKVLLGERNLDKEYKAGLSASE